MVYNEHYVELFVNGSPVELEGQDSLNLRFNNVILDPTKISTTQAEYSFEFDIPATPANNKVFDYANNLSKTNKFHQRWSAEVYADGNRVFTGSLTLNSFKDDFYSCNLVSVKVNSLEDIFGEDMMDKIDWKIPFEGGGSGDNTIDYYNSLDNPGVTFPLVSYGVFQKYPYNEDTVSNDYTSKFELDQYTKWYVESFYPSANMLETVKRAFETKGYHVGGDAFVNPYLKDIYMSTNLANDQTPDYNIGNPKFGEVDINVDLTTHGISYQQELQFPYYKVSGIDSQDTENGITVRTEYNYTAIDIHDMLMQGSISQAHPSYMYQPNENVIVIPADGFYKIEMEVTSTINDPYTRITVAQNLYDPISRKFTYEDINMYPGLFEITPLEIQLVRNYDDNIELIKGKYNRTYTNGNPMIPSYTISGRYYSNITDWETCFPHEDPYNSELPTEQNDLRSKNTVSRFGGNRSSSTSSTGSSNRMGGTRSGTIDMTGGGRNYSPLNLGYVYRNNEIMCYDQAVSPAFICGFSTMSNGVVSVMKNGYSWSPITAEKNEVFAPVEGYDFERREAGTGYIVYDRSTKNETSYINAPVARVSVNDLSMNGKLSCIVRLNKNDILSLMAVHRLYETEIGNVVPYSTTSNVHLKITAFSPRTYTELATTHSNRYEAPVEFDTRLDIANFFNNEKKISEWIKNVVDAFNLGIVQEGNNIFINTHKKVNNNILSAVEIDDRVNSAEATAKSISYPRSMAIKYKIDTDEWGFERSAVNSQGGDESILDNADWIKYGNSGFTTIELNDDTFVTSTNNKDLQFSYTWYDAFNWHPAKDHFLENDNVVTLRLPVISKFSYMIDGYDYEESMKHDGFSLAQRFWFRPKDTGCYVWTDVYPTERIQIYAPSNTYNGINLSYKNTEQSLLTEFFNVNTYLSSNYVEVDVYLSPEEYNRIKNGSLIHFDSDLYYPVEISGYDVTGKNTTTLRMMKKVI